MNLLNSSENENSKFARKKLYVIDSDAKRNYWNDHSIKCFTKSLESSLCAYSDAYILVTGNITVNRRNAADTDDIALGTITQVAFKNLSPFKNCRTEINDTFVDDADFINITMSMHNLIAYGDNYSDISVSLLNWIENCSDNAN